MEAQLYVEKQYLKKNGEGEKVRKHIDQEIREEIVPPVASCRRVHSLSTIRIAGG